MRLSAQNLGKRFRKREVVRDVSIDVDTGEIVGLLGPNGAGKTTIFYMMVGLIGADKGKIFLGDDSITHLPMYQRARRGLGYLPQEPSIFRKLTVEENLFVVLEAQGISRGDQKKRAGDLLEELNLGHLSKNKAFSLSGGERRRLEITRALVNNPKFLLLDEPFAGVDPIAIIEIQKIIKSLKNRGIGILITDHNVQETLAITDHSYIINEGMILEAGTSVEISNSEKARAIYLGDKFRFSGSAQPET